jgi:hypothetical protein
MCKHVKKCWGSDVIEAVDRVKDREEALNSVVKGFLRNGSIADVFEKGGKGKPTYSNCQLTQTEMKAAMVRWAAKSKWPFKIADDIEFRFMMKTGRPSIYIPSPMTVSRDTKRVFAVVRNWVAALLRVRQVYS